MIYCFNHQQPIISNIQTPCYFHYRFLKASVIQNILTDSLHFIIMLIEIPNHWPWRQLRFKSKPVLTWISTLLRVSQFRWLCAPSETCLNISISSYQYQDSHYQDKMVTNVRMWNALPAGARPPLARSLPPIHTTPPCPLTHWGRVTHICISKLTIIGSDNGLSPDRRQAIIWTNAGFLLIGPLGTNFSEIVIKIQRYSFKKMRFKVSSAKRRPFCLGLNVFTN